MCLATLSERERPRKRGQGWQILIGGKSLKTGKPTKNFTSVYNGGEYKEGVRYEAETPFYKQSSNAYGPRHFSYKLGFHIFLKEEDAIKVLGIIKSKQDNATKNLVIRRVTWQNQIAKGNVWWYKNFTKVCETSVVVTKYRTILADEKR